MNSSSTQTNLVLDGFFTLLACGKCKQTPERPIRFMTCDHFFCDTCVENDEVCSQCNAPVEPCEKRPHYTVAQLINYCKTVKEMVSDLDVGDLWPLANAIHRFTDEHIELAKEPELRSEKVTERVQPEERDEDINLEPETVGYIESTQCQRQNKSDVHAKNTSIVNLSQNDRTREENDLEPLSSKQNIRRLEEVNVQHENPSFVNSKEIGKSHEENYLQPENGSFVNSMEIDRIRKENDVWPENVSFVHSTQIIKGRRDGDAESETPGYIDPTQISPIHKNVNFESETPGYRDPTQAVRQLEESNFDPESRSYRYPTQVSQRQSERYMDDETAGYIDPTPVNRPRRSSEEEPNAVPETKLPSITNWQDDMELDIGDKDLFSPIPETNMDDTLAPETLEMEVSFCDGDVIPETLEVDKDTPYDRDSPNVSNARNSARLTEEFMDGILAKQRMRMLQRKTYPMSDYDTPSTRLHKHLSDLSFDNRNTNSIDNFDTLSVPDGRLSVSKRQSRILVNDRDAFRVAGAPLKQLRRIRDLKLDRQREIPITPRESLNSASRDFTSDSNGSVEPERIRKLRENTPMTDDTMSIDSVRDTAMETIETVEKTQPILLSLMRDGTLDRGTLGTPDTRDTSRRPAEIEKEAPVKHLRRLSVWEVERRKRISNNRDGMESPHAYNDAEKKEEAPVKQPRRIRDLKIVRPNETPNDSRDRPDIADLRDFDTETEEIAQATRVNDLARIKDLAMDRMNKDSLSDRDTLLFTNGGHLAETTDFETDYIQFGDENSPIKRGSKISTTDYNTTKPNCAQESSMKIVESAKREPPRQLGRLTNWPLNRHSMKSINDCDTIDVTNIEDSDAAPEKIPEIRPPKQLKPLQNSKPGNRSMMPSDLHGVDITNIQDFDRGKLFDGPPTNDSDTVDVDDVRDLLAESEKIPEVRPLRQLKRLQHSRPGHHSIQPSDLRGVNITNIEEFAKDRTSLMEHAPSRGGNFLTTRPSKIPTTIRNLSPIATAVGSATETLGQAPLKQLRSVENLENCEAHDNIPAKKGKAKIVQLKPRRRTIDKSSAGSKAVPKNVNKRNVKGETLLHTACVKGQDDYVKALLEAGANPNTKDNASWTPLQEVVRLGRREICEMLLQFGASPNTPGIENRTALHDASQNDKLAEATLLLRFNANRDVYDKYGKRPIDYAISDEMRALLTKDNAAERTTGEVACLNTTLDQSIPTANAKVVVLPSNLNSKNKKALSQVASKLKIAVATSFRPGVTHIVVEANERNTTELSNHVILAILQGIWILNSQWIAISADLNDISEIDLELFEVHGAPNPGTPERSRMNEEKQNPRLFNNCFFYFTISARGTWSYGKLEFTKASLTTLILAGQGEVLRREPNPEDVKDNAITPFHVAHKPIHPLHRCSHYIIYMPGKDEPRVKYNMPHIKTLPLAWLLECIEKFVLVDPILMGIS